MHRLRNLLAKLPERERERIRGAYWEALDDATSPADGRDRLHALVDELDRGGYTAAAKCLADDLDALVVHLRYPLRHRRRWRSTNLLERSLAEVKRRTKVIGRFPGETSCLTLVWAVLDLYLTHAKNGVRFSQLERQRLARMRYPDDRNNHRRGGHRRLDSPTRNLSHGEFTAAKRRHPDCGWNIATSPIQPCQLARRSGEGDHRP